MKFSIIFTDLDGTLLNHQNYSFAAAKPALEKIRQLNIPLIFNSSKTIAEILEYRLILENRHPFIVENGGAIYIPQHYFTGTIGQENIHILGVHRDQQLALIHEIRNKHQYQFTGFADLSVAELREHTGLTEQQAINAKQRIASEPILWQDSNKQLSKFKQELEHLGMKILKGGRFLHVIGQTDKAIAMQWLVEQYRRAGHADITTIALGDSQNDIAMLEQADLAAVIRSAQGTHMIVNKPVYYTQYSAPEGWREAIDKILLMLQTEQ